MEPKTTKRRRTAMIKNWLYEYRWVLTVLALFLALLYWAEPKRHKVENPNYSRIAVTAKGR